jgi:hypothetical protein
LNPDPFELGVEIGVEIVGSVMPVGFVSPVSMVEVDAKAMFEAD